MKVELDKEGLIALVSGCSPTYSQMDLPQIKSVGAYIGGFHDKWEWHHSGGLDDLTEEELMSLYNLMKDNWK